MGRLQIKERSADNRIWKEHKACMLAFSILLLLWGGIMVYMRYAPFGNNSLLQNDAIHQYYPLMAQYRDRLLSSDGIFYSTGGGLGFNFYGLWTYYLSSPLNLVLVFFPVTQVDSAMNLLIILKLILSGVTFAYYLEQRKERSELKMVPFALGYALSTFMIGYCYNIMWMDTLALFPVIMAGMESLLKRGKWKQYTVTLALSLWCSFYLSFIVCLFLVLWFLLYKHPSFKAFMKKGVHFAGCSVLSAGLACVVLLPAYLGIVQSQAKTAFPEFEWMGQFSEIFASKEGGIFVFSNPLSLNNEVAYQANLYCGVFVVGFTVLFFLAKDIAFLQKVKAGWFLALFILSFNNQALNYIWHGFHYQVGIPNRFAFLFLFLLLLFSYEALLRIKTYKAWQIISSGVAALAIYGIAFFQQKENVTNKMLYCTLIFTVVYMILQLLVKYETDLKGYMQNLLLVFMCLELCANALVSNRLQVGVCADNFYREKQDTQQMADTLAGNPYRVELSNPTVTNEGMAYNLQGTGLFSSMTNPNTINLLHNIGFSTSSNSYLPAGSTPVLNTLFGIRDYLVLGTDAKRLDYRYKEKDTIGKVTAYENEQVLPIAYLCEDTVSAWDSMKGDFFLNQMELLKLMTGKNYKVYTEQEYELKESNDIEVSPLDEHQQFTYLAAKGTRNDHVVFEAAADTDEDLYLRLQARYSNKTSIYVNDKAIAYKDLSSSFYHIGNVKKGDKIRVEIGIQENSATYGMISMSMYAYHQEVMDEVYKALDEGRMKITQYRDGYLKGKVTVRDPKKTLFTTIPYEKGWSVYVDGKKQKVQTVQGAFLKLELKEGTHEVELIYEVPGIWSGAILTAVSVCIFTGIVLTARKRKRQAEEGKRKAV